MIRSLLLNHDLLHEKVVGCSEVVVLVVLYRLDQTLFVESHLRFKLVHYFVVDILEGPLNVKRGSLRLMKFIPRVVPYFLNPKSFIRVSDEDVLDHVFGLRREELGHLVVCTHDFLVQVRGFLIL